MSVETPDGKLLRFESEIGMGPTPIRTTGQVKGDRLEIETTGTAAAAAKNLDSLVGRLRRTVRRRADRCCASRCSPASAAR